MSECNNIGFIGHLTEIEDFGQDFSVIQWKVNRAFACDIPISSFKIITYFLG